MNREYEYIVSTGQSGSRLDVFLSSLADLQLTRSHIKKLIADGLVKLNDQVPKPSYKVKLADRVQVTLGPAVKREIGAEDIPLDIIFEDDDLIVVNKPRGMVSHPACGNFEHTLVNALMHHLKGEMPLLVHRLDKDTSGLIVAAKNEATQLALAKQFKDRTVTKTYLALVHGVMKDKEGSIDARIGRHPVNRKKMAILDAEPSKKSREALTLYQVKQNYGKYTLVEIQTKTGRTHQIRVHMTHIGHPLVGDETYGKRADDLELKGQFLHAFKLGFIHPRTKQPLGFTAPLPDELQKILKHVVRS